MPYELHWYENGLQNDKVEPAAHGPQYLADQYRRQNHKQRYNSPSSSNTFEKGRK